MDWEVVVSPDKKVARQFIRDHHYTKSCSNTGVYIHELRRKSDGELMGVAQWLPPTKLAAITVSKDNWRRVLSLTRLAIHPDVPKNGASFLLGRSIRMIKAIGEWPHLVTYADEWQGHEGAIYKATNWQYVGCTKPARRYINSEGKFAATLSTKTRTKEEMNRLGFFLSGEPHVKHKFVMHLVPSC